MIPLPYPFTSPSHDGSINLRALSQEINSLINIPYQTVVVLLLYTLYFIVYTLMLHSPPHTLLMKEKYAIFIMHYNKNNHVEIKCVFISTFLTGVVGHDSLR